MSEVPFAFAFAAGLLATVNPCGFIMLPAFVAHQLGAREPGFHAQPLLVRGARAAWVAAVATSGFVTVFAGAGAVFALGGRVLLQLVPWAALAIGLVLVAVGVSGLLGKTVVLRLPDLAPTGPARGLLALFLFGIGYAIASLSCTLPIFLVVVGSALAAGGLVAAVGLFLAYALGMGAVLWVVALATALLKGVVVQWLVALTPYVERLGALLLIAAGAYLVYYQLSTGFVWFLGS
ncbi:MAG TPA: cytochrome c biogenesis protein CcdA [Chloroflexota bacterium]|nr:cytochrome c biogenesis protein CcdA [Chloroflexota bacterium]